MKRLFVESNSPRFQIVGDYHIDKEIDIDKELHDWFLQAMILKSIITETNTEVNSLKNIEIPDGRYVLCNTEAHFKQNVIYQYDKLGEFVVHFKWNGNPLLKYHIDESYHPMIKRLTCTGINLFGGMFDLFIDAKPLNPHFIKVSEK